MAKPNREAFVVQLDEMKAAGEITEEAAAKLLNGFDTATGGGHGAPADTDPVDNV